MSTQSDKNLATNFKELFDKHVERKLALVQAWSNKKKKNLAGIKNENYATAPPFIIDNVIDEIVNIMISLYGIEDDKSIEEQRRLYERSVKNQLFGLEILQLDDNNFIVYDRQKTNNIIEN